MDANSPNMNSSSASPTPASALPRLILHITTEAAWAAGQAAGAYRVPSLETEGFMHASRYDQMASTATRIYRGATDRILLVVDTARVTAPLMVEYAPRPNDWFPHIHGALNPDAVIAVKAFPCNADGSFTLPPDLPPQPVDPSPDSA